MKYYKQEQGLFNPYNLDAREYQIYFLEKGFILALSGQDESFLKLNAGLVEIKAEEFEELKKKSATYTLEWEQIKRERAAELAAAAVEVRKILLDADEVAMSRIARGVSVANAQFNLALAAGKSAAEAGKVYETKVQWKGKDNSFYEFTLKELLNALELGIANQQKLWSEYN